MNTCCILSVLHEDDELLVVNKPAGLVCHPSKQGPVSSLIGRMRLYLQQSSTETPEPRLVNRLDRETSGVVVAAKTAGVAGELGRLWERRSVEKEYIAIVTGNVREDDGMIDAPLGKDITSPVVIKDTVRPDGAPAQTRYAVLKRFTRPEGMFTLLRLCPLTGRKHQLRIHMAHAGHPIVGDKLYGSDETCYLRFVAGQMTEADRARLILSHHALHAGILRWEWRGVLVEFRAAPETWFTQFHEGLP